MGGADGNGSADPLEIPPEIRPEIPSEIPSEIPPEFHRDTRWLSYRELAEVLAPTKIDSVVRLVRRKRWTKRTSNNGIRVAVPADFLADIQGKQRRGPSGQVPDSSRSKPAKQPDQELAGHVAAIREEHAVWAAEMAAVRADMERERARADRLEAEVRGLLAETAELRSRADRAEGMAEGLKTAQAQAPTQAQAPPSRFVIWVRSVREAFRP